MSGHIATISLISPIGPITITASNTHLVSLRIGMMATDALAHTPLLQAAREQIEQYFAGERTHFDLPLSPPPNQDSAKHRAAIASIAYGETCTYGVLAARIGSAAQAVGQACKTNAFPLIIPCHRVVSTSGPEYYSAGDGPRTKSWLLDFEYDHLPLERRTRLL